MPAQKKRRLLAAAAIVLLLALLFGGDLRTRAYVRLHHRQLEDFAVSALEGPQDGALTYGAWTACRYPEKGMVEFFTGGFGLAPSAVYKGFYYSANDVHIPFQGVDQPMEINGAAAEWREPESDNWGRSRRIMPHWFWYEAHF